MKAEDLSDAIGGISPSLTEEYLAAPTVLPARRPWRRIAAAAAAVCVLAVSVWGVSTHGGRGVPLAPVSDPAESVSSAPTEDTAAPTKATAKTTAKAPTQSVSVWRKSTLALAQYPEMTPYPESVESWEDWERWSDDVRRQQKMGMGAAAGTEEFCRRLMRQALTGRDGENRVCSPLNLYLSLGMLAESAAGKSRQQILSLLGVKDIAALRQKASALWNGNYRDDGAVMCRMASSVWLDNTVTPVPATADALAKHYYASSFQGDMTDPRYADAIRDWLNEQTGQLLQDQVQALDFPPGMLAVLSGTVEFRAKWQTEFNPANNRTMPFHTAGGDKDCTFLYADMPMETVFFGDDYTAYRKLIDNGPYNMWFVLPDEGKTPDTVLAGKDLLTMIGDQNHWKQQGQYHLKLAVPKFDVTSDREMSDDLRALGVTDVLDDMRADLSGLAQNAGALGLYLDHVQHAARVAIDEEGVTATAYTVEELCGSGMLTKLDTIEMTLDRPFLFLITGVDNAVLFAGVVENP